MVLLTGIRASVFHRSHHILSHIQPTLLVRVSLSTSFPFHPPLLFQQSTQSTASTHQVSELGETLSSFTTNPPSMAKFDEAEVEMVARRLPGGCSLTEAREALNCAINSPTARDIIHLHSPPPITDVMAPEARDWRVKVALRLLLLRRLVQLQLCTDLEVCWSALEKAEWSFCTLLSLCDKGEVPTITIGQTGEELPPLLGGENRCFGDSVHIPDLKTENGLRIPCVGLGTFKLRGDDLTTAMNAALELGYRYYDCAHLYANEAEIGDHLGAWIHSGRIAREDLFITSKLWNTFHRPELVKTACETSIKRLQVEYLDLYLIHWPVPYQPGDVMLPRDTAGNTLFDEVDLLDTWKAMENLVTLGLCRYVGVSNFNSTQLQRILSNCRIPPAMLQIESNATFPNQSLIDFSHSRGIPVTAYYALGCPYLHFKRGVLPLMEQPLILELAKKYCKTPAQIALRHGLQRGICVIFKSKTPARLAENLQVFDFELSREDMRRLEELGSGTRVLKGAAMRQHPEFPFTSDN
ncbi:15-anhydro-D-fructose reductase [Taenia crassiceps]|uniref:15-anhydro-D-fructose reductase n=1 Tax=Taenia crassiceps TaxID=6207 RepID=A0ABR4Q1X9_9CEST